MHSDEFMHHSLLKKKASPCLAHSNFPCITSCLPKVKKLSQICMLRLTNTSDGLEWEVPLLFQGTKPGKIVLKAK